MRALRGRPGSANTSEPQSDFMIVATGTLRTDQRQQPVPVYQPGRVQRRRQLGTAVHLQHSGAPTAM